MENIAQHKDKPLFHLVNGDIRDSRVVNAVVKNVDAVFHEAAFVDVSLSVKDPLLCEDINVHGTLNLLRASFRF